MPSLAARCLAALPLTAAVAAAALIAVPATAGAAPTAPPSGCPYVKTVQPFSPWGDVAEYILAPAGNFENRGAASWALTGGAAAVEGNEPWRVGAKTDHLALSIPAGATATSATMCIGVEHKTMRFFARGLGSLSVDVLYSAANGAPQSTTLGRIDGSREWAPSDILDMKVNELAAARGNAMPVAFRFTAKGGSGWTIDDVYVDPFRVR